MRLSPEEQKRQEQQEKVAVLVTEAVPDLTRSVVQGGENYDGWSLADAIEDLLKRSRRVAPSGEPVAPQDRTLEMARREREQADTSSVVVMHDNGVDVMEANGIKPGMWVYVMMGGVATKAEGRVTRIVHVEPLCKEPTALIQWRERQYAALFPNGVPTALLREKPGGEAIVFGAARRAS